MSRVSDHRLYLFYEFALDDAKVEPLFALPPDAPALGARLRSLAGTPPILAGAAGATPRPWPPADALPALGARYADTPIWAPRALPIGKDLEVGVQQIFAPHGPFTRAAGLGEVAARLLKRADLYEGSVDGAARTRKRLALSLTRAAAGRIAAATGETAVTAERASVLVTIEDLTATVFRTGQGVAMMSVSLAPRALDGDARFAPHPVWLVEAVHALSRFNALRWRDARTLTPVEGHPGFSLGWMARSLLDARGLVAESQGFRRVFTACYAQIAGHAAQSGIDTLAYRLSRHYTDDYAVAPDLPGMRVVRHFSTVGHYAACEGAATLLTPDAGPPAAFLDSYRATTFEPHYLPLLQLALHERAVQRDLARRARFWPAMRRARDDGGRLRRAELALLEDIADRRDRLRLCYRHRLVSGVTMHNAYAQELRAALQLDLAQRELDDDVLAIRAALGSDALRRHRRRFRWAGLLASGALVTLAASSLFKEALEAWRSPPERLVSIVLLAASAAVGIAAAVIAWRQDEGSPAEPEGGEHGEAGHLAHHAMVDNIIHAAAGR